MWARPDAAYPSERVLFRGRWSQKHRGAMAKRNGKSKKKEEYPPDAQLGALRKRVGVTEGVDGFREKRRLGDQAHQDRGGKGNGKLVTGTGAGSYSDQMVKEIEFIH